MKLSRPDPIFVELESAPGKAWIVPPCNRAQMREVLGLDPEAGAEPSTPVAVDERLAKQLRILTRDAYEVHPQTQERIEPGAAFPVDTLTGGEERQLAIALVCHHFGTDPVAAVTAGNALKKKALLTLLVGLVDASPNSTETVSSSPSS